jgi:hypothetical protein
MSVRRAKETADFQNHILQQSEQAWRTGRTEGSVLSSLAAKITCHNQFCAGTNVPCRTRINKPGNSIFQSKTLRIPGIKKRKEFGTVKF